MAKITCTKIALTPEQIEALQKMLAGCNVPNADGSPSGILLAQVFPWNQNGLSPHMIAAWYPTASGGRDMAEAHKAAADKHGLRRVKSRLEPYKVGR